MVRERLQTFCRRHGAKLLVGQLRVAYLCDPGDEDTIYVPDMSPCLTLNTLVMQDQSKDWMVKVGDFFPQMVLSFPSHLYSWPSIVEIGGPPLGYYMGGDTVTMKLVSEKGKSEISGIIGSSLYQDWAIPIDSLLCLYGVQIESALVNLIFFWMVTIENRCSFPDVLRISGGKKVSEEIVLPFPFVSGRRQEKARDQERKEISYKEKRKGREKEDRGTMENHRKDVCARCGGEFLLEEFSRSQRKRKRGKRSCPYCLKSQDG